MIYLDNKLVKWRLPSEVPQLDPEQISAADAMIKRHSFLLISDPGAGKTLTAIEALVGVTDKFGELDKHPLTVVICPKIAYRNWAIWLEYVMSIVYQDRYTKIQVITGNSTSKIHPDTTHVICGYGSFSRQGSKLAKMLKQMTVQVMILDESDNLSGVGSARTKAILGKDGIAHSSYWCWFLTGTPVPRYNDGLWPTLSCRFMTRLKSFGVHTKEKFDRVFCVVERKKFGNMRFAKPVVTGSKNNKLLKQVLYDGNPIAARNKLRLDQPNIIENFVEFDKSDELKLLEEELDKNREIEVDEYGPVSSVDPRMTTALRVLGEESCVASLESVSDLIQKEKEKGRGVLLLYWHKNVGTMLYNTAQAMHLTVDKIDGATKVVDHERIESAFNNGELDVLCGQIKSMGVAINLQHNCNTVVFIEETFSHAMNLQAYQRVWRRGQEHPVNVVFCRPDSTLTDLRPKVSKKKQKSAKEALD